MPPQRQNPCSLRRLDVLAILIIMLAFILALKLDMRVHPGPDPDRWFHLAISRMQAERGGFLRELPQVDDLGWARAFPEKEFLFHAFTTIGYRILGGDRGALFVGYLLGVTLLLLLFYGSRRSGMPTIAAAAIVVVMMLGTSYFSPRLFMLRPHLASQVFFVALALTLAHQKPGLAFLSALLCTLSYHALYVPLGLTALAALLVERGAEHRTRASLAASCGLLAGLLVNPYFPQNVNAIFISLRIALTNDQITQGMEAGRELLQLPIGTFALFFALPLAAASASGYAAWRLVSPDKKEERRTIAFFVLAAFGLWLITARNPRASEYAVPMSVLAIATAFRSLHSAVLRASRLKVFFIAIAATAVLLLGPARHIASMGAGEPELRPAALTSAALAALDQIPKTAARQKVFNCDWPLGSFVLYKRPDLKFTDLSDPLLLAAADRRKYELVRRLKLGQELDAAASISAHLHAQYVLCHRPTLNTLLDSDPQASVIWRDSLSGLALYSLDVSQQKNATFPRIANTYEVNLFGGEVDTTSPNFEKRFPMQGTMVNQRTLDFFSMFGTATDVERCAWVKITEAEIRANQGAHAIAIGGGPHVRVWLNRRLIFRSEPYFDSPRILHEKKIRLEHPLRATDRIETAVCRKHASFWNFALWFYSELGI